MKSDTLLKENMDEEDIEAFLLSLIAGTELAYRSYAETAHSYYAKHGHLTDGLIRSVQTNAFRQNRKVPKGLSNRPDVDDEIEKLDMPDNFCITLSVDSEPSLLLDLALIFRRLAKRNQSRQQP